MSLPEDGPSDADRLIAWLATRPPDATLAWTEPTLVLEHGFKSDWVDVYFEEADTLKVVLTLSAPGTAADPTDPLDAMEVPYDATWEVSFADGRVTGMRLLPDDDAPVTLGRGPFADELEDPEQWSVWWRNRLTRDERDPSRWTRRVWTVGRLSRALADWAAAYADRPDLRFAYRPEAAEPDPTEADEEELRDEPRVQIGDGLVATSSAFDALLASDPDEAAEITRDMQRIADEARAAPRRRPGE